MNSMVDKKIVIHRIGFCHEYFFKHHYLENIFKLMNSGNSRRYYHSY